MKTDIIEGFLEKYHGRVKDHFPQIDKDFHIPSGAWTFVMLEEDLKLNPIPECVYLNNQLCFVSYRTQASKCHRCGGEDHLMRDCKERSDFPQIGGNEGEGCNVFLDGKIPKAPQKVVKPKEVVKDVVLKEPNENGVDGDTSEEIAKEATEEFKKPVDQQKADAEKNKKKFDNDAKATSSSKLKDNTEMNGGTNNANTYVKPISTSSKRKSREDDDQEADPAAKIRAEEEEEVHSDWEEIVDEEHKIIHWDETMDIGGNEEVTTENDGDPPEKVT